MTAKETKEGADKAVAVWENYRKSIEDGSYQHRLLIKSIDVKIEYAAIIKGDYYIYTNIPYKSASSLGKHYKSLGYTVTYHPEMHILHSNWFKANILRRKHPDLSVMGIAWTSPNKKVNND